MQRQHTIPTPVSAPTSSSSSASSPNPLSSCSDSSSLSAAWEPLRIRVFVRATAALLSSSLLSSARSSFGVRKWKPKDSGGLTRCGKKKKGMSEKQKKKVVTAEASLPAVACELAVGSACSIWEEQTGKEKWQGNENNRQRNTKSAYRIFLHLIFRFGCFVFWFIRVFERSKNARFSIFEDFLFQRIMSHFSACLGFANFRHANRRVKKPCFLADCPVMRKNSKQMQNKPRRRLFVMKLFAFHSLLSLVSFLFWSFLVFLFWSFSVFLLIFRRLASLCLWSPSLQYVDVLLYRGKEISKMMLPLPNQRGGKRFLTLEELLSASFLVSSFPAPHFCALFVGWLLVCL